ncbi:MAG: phosphate acyltransferase PlsX [Bacilli bacterium]|nr:phosphate acyltransferase PlsX [Bacilli bacterium]
MKIVVDMLGGDLGIAATYEGLKSFVSKHPDVEVFAVGPSGVLNGLPNIKIIEANKFVKMNAHAMELLHDKESSMAKAIDTLMKEDADAIVSCGGTGALLTFASIKVKKLNNVLRPALISPIPTLKENKHTLLLDLGANSENKVEELVDFAKMASLYYQEVYLTKPTIALLSNGSEEGKGSPLVQATYEKLKGFDGFVGNIESSEILKGNVDIIIADGFTGNIALKAIEGTGNVVKTLLKDTFKKSFKNKLAYLLVRKDLKKQLMMLSSKPLGGAMFIGLKKVVIKAHGNSDAEAFNNALVTAYRCVKSDLVNKLSKE